MKVFQDLFIRGTPEALINIINEIEVHLDEGWTREHDREKSLSDKSAMKWYAFHCHKKENRPAAFLCITENDKNELYVPNIVPEELTQLSYDQYNGILQEFTRRFVSPAAKATGVHFELSDSEKSIVEWLPPAAIEALRRFYGCANISTGIAHPNDEKRWNEFIVIAHKIGVRIDGFTFKRVLIEDEGWQEEIADKLSSDFERSISLLNFYDQNQ